MTPEKAINTAVLELIRLAPESKPGIIINPNNYNKLDFNKLLPDLIFEQSNTVAFDVFYITDLNQKIKWSEIPLPWYKKLWYWIKNLFK